MLQVLSLGEGSSEFPEKGISGRMRVPTSVFEGTLWKNWREGDDMAMTRIEGVRGLSG